MSEVKVNKLVQEQLWYTQLDAGDTITVSGDLNQILNQQLVQL